jgi:hypothetical protein
MGSRPHARILITGPQTTCLPLRKRRPVPICTPSLEREPEMKANHTTAAILALLLSLSAPALANMAPPEPLPPAPATDPSTTPPADPAAAPATDPAAAPTDSPAPAEAAPPEAASAPEAPAEPATPAEGNKNSNWTLALVAAFFGAGVAIFFGTRGKKS